MPLLKTLYIDKLLQMNLALAFRFQDVREIHIYSLLTLTIFNHHEDEVLKDVVVDFETKIRVQLFLLGFDTVEQVLFQVQVEEEMGVEKFALANAFFFLEGYDIYPTKGPRDQILAFIDLISGDKEIKDIRVVLPRRE